MIGGRAKMKLTKADARCTFCHADVPEGKGVTAGERVACTRCVEGATKSPPLGRFVCSFCGRGRPTRLLNTDAHMCEFCVPTAAEKLGVGVS